MNTPVPPTLSPVLSRPRAGFLPSALGPAVFVCLLLLALCGPSMAAETEFSIGLGTSVETSPYKGVNTQWKPVGVVSLESERFYVREYTAGLKLLNLEFLEVSVFGGYDDTSFDASESNERRMRKLRDRNSSAVAGTEARLITPYGMLHVSAARDVLGNSEGWNGALGYKLLVEHGDLEVIPATGLYWADSAYNDYYYGVSGKESRKSGIGAHDAGSGLSPYVRLTMDYSLATNWSVFCSGEMTFLSTEVKDSPMVGNSRTQSVTMGVTYDF